jgi:hypothetical protein
MSERALRYRARRGMLDKDEQMALLVMRVSGAMYGRNFYPQAAGVGFSFNPYAWDPAIDPKAGVMRLVFGLGTRAVDRSDDDYTRVVALNAPDKRPEGNFDKVRQYAQRRVDYLDLEANQLVSDHFSDVIQHNEGLHLDMFATRDVIRLPNGKRRRQWLLTFDKLLKQTGFVQDMQDILESLERAYEYPVDIEFTMNFMEDNTYRINLVQCRPLQVQGAETVDLPDVEIIDKNRIIEARGAVVGQSRRVTVDRFIYVVPEHYGKLPVQDRYEIAHLIGHINRETTPDIQTVMAIGPGRWGTSSPSLGIPVTFAEINRITVLCEIVAMHETLVPDVSLGTHFLNELVEMNMLYLALFPQQGSNYLNHPFFEQPSGRLLELVPSACKWKDIVRVIDVKKAALNSPVRIHADAREQKVICYMDTKE